MRSGRKKVRHAWRTPCPKCHAEGKIRFYRAYVSFICQCGVNIQAPDIDRLNVRLEEIGEEIKRQMVMY